MAAARRQQEYVPLSLEYTIVKGQPIYLVDVDGTLIKGSQRLNDGLVAFLSGKPNVFIFTKMSHDTVRTAVDNVKAIGLTPFLIRYNLINELRERGVTIQGVITPGDVRRTEKSATGSTPGTHYVNYLGKLEYDSYVKSPSGKPAFLSPGEEAKEREEYDANQELKNEMYKMAKNYFSMVYNNKRPIVFIDDEYDQLFSVGLQELIEPALDSIKLMLIKVDPVALQSQEFFTEMTDVMDGTQRNHPVQILYNDIENIIGEYFSSLNDRALANKKRELLAFLNTMSPIPPEKREFIERIRDLLNNWPAEPRAPAPIAVRNVAPRRPEESLTPEEIARITEIPQSELAGTQRFSNARVAAAAGRNPNHNNRKTMSRREAGVITDIPRNRVAGSNEYWNSVAAVQERNAPILQPYKWICPDCTYMNKDESKNCEICNAPRPAATKWACPACTYVNKEGSQTCEMCEAPRPQAGGSKKYKSKNKKQTKKTLKSKKTKKTKKNLKSKKSKKITKNRK